MGSSSPAASGPALAPYEHRTVPALFLSGAGRHAARLAFRRAPLPHGLTFAEAHARVARLVSLIGRRGIGSGDRVAILSENRPEWALADYACLCAGAVTVPIYPNLPVSYVREILRDSGARLVFTSTHEQAVRVGEAAGDLTPLVFDDLDLHLAGTPDPPAGWETRALEIAPEDLATLIYTSGTTGSPKGVMLTHGNLAGMIAATAQHGSIPVTPGDVVVSILPLSHALERAAAYYFWASGATTVYAESMQTVARDIAAAAPHHLVVVPRLLEKIHQTLTSGHGAAGVIARWAAGVSVPVARRLTSGRRLSYRQRAELALADRFVFSVLRRKLGGRVRTVISGGAPLAADVASLFIAAGIPVFEGYGLTETSPVLAANRPGAVRLGSVGLPYPGVELRVGHDDEIHARGPTVMRGYWQRPVETEQAFTSEGWFRTGDIGHIDQDGFVHITDRLKDVIVTSGGKNIAPQPIELRVQASPYIAQALLIGDRRPYAAMLVVPDFAALEAWAAARRPPGPGAGTTRAALVADPGVVALLEREVDERTAEFAQVERPKRIAIVADEFTVENGMLTPTLKIRRRMVEERYADLIGTMYGAARPAV